MAPVSNLPQEGDDQTGRRSCRLPLRGSCNPLIVMLMFKASKGNALHSRIPQKPPNQDDPVRALCHVHVNGPNGPPELPQEQAAMPSKRRPKSAHRIKPACSVYQCKWAAPRPAGLPPCPRVCGRGDTRRAARCGATSGNADPNTMITVLLAAGDARDMMHHPADALSRPQLLGPPGKRTRRPGAGLKELPRAIPCTDGPQSPRETLRGPSPDKHKNMEPWHSDTTPMFAFGQQCNDTEHNTYPGRAPQRQSTTRRRTSAATRTKKREHKRPPEPEALRKASCTRDITIRAIVASPRRQQRRPCEYERQALT